MRRQRRIKALDLAGQVTFVDTAGKEGGAHLIGSDHRECILAATWPVTLLRELVAAPAIPFLGGGDLIATGADGVTAG